MSKPFTLFSYGCARSGTTYLRKMLDLGTGYHHVHIRETDSHHPSISPTGLLRLNQLFRDHQVVFVRIFREPEAILESFMTAWLAEGMIDRFPKSDLVSVVRIISEERKNTEHQIKGLTGSFVEVSYELLDDVLQQDMFVRRLVEVKGFPDKEENRALFVGHLRQTFNERAYAVRDGRLSQGIEEHYATPENLRECLLDALLGS